mgnify:FL=1
MGFLFVNSVFANSPFLNQSDDGYCGRLSNDTKWNSDIFRITCPLTIDAGVTLTIESNTVLQFLPNSSLHVYGSLIVEGSDTEPVIFTANTSPPYPGFWESSLQSPGDWDAIYFYPGSHGIIENAIIEYGGTNAYGNIHVFGGDITIQKSVIRFSSKSALFSNGWVSLLDNHFTNNAREAVRLEITQGSSAPVKIQGNKGKGNGKDIILIQGQVNTETNLGRNPGLPYVIDFLVINPMQTLTFDAGSLVKLSRNDSNDASIIEVKGSLLAKGTEDYPVVFTSLYDKEYDEWNNSDLIAGVNPNQDYSLFIPIVMAHIQPFSRNYQTDQQDEREPMSGDWRGILISKSGYAELSHLVIRYAGYPHSQLTVLSGNCVLDHVRIEKGYLNGIYAEDTSLVMRDSIVSDHPGFGVKLHGKTEYIQPIIERNTFNNNGTYGLYIILNGGGIGKGKISGNSGSGNGMVNGIYVEGYITDQSSQWDVNPDFPYVVWTVTVQPEAKLTVAPGVVIKFINPPTNPENELPFERGRGCFINSGTIEAMGTLAQPIVFTSYWDDEHGGDTNGNYGGTEPQPGDWWSFIIRSGGKANLTYTYFLYGGNDGMAVRVDGGELNMQHSIIQYSKNVGVGGTGTINLNYSSIMENLGNGVQLNGPSNIQWNVIINNKGYGLVNYYNPSQGYIATATNNFWGTPDGPSSDDLPCPYSLPNGNGSKVSCLVEWNPYLPEIPVEVSNLLSNLSN